MNNKNKFGFAFNAIDTVSPYELRRGIAVEMSKDKKIGKEEAEELAVANLEKDPAYYTNEVQKEIEKILAKGEKDSSWVRKPEKKEEESEFTAKDFKRDSIEPVEDMDTDKKIKDAPKDKKVKQMKESIMKLVQEVLNEEQNDGAPGSIEHFKDFCDYHNIENYTKVIPQYARKYGLSREEVKELKKDVFIQLESINEDESPEEKLDNWLKQLEGKYKGIVNISDAYKKYTKLPLKTRKYYDNSFEKYIDNLSKITKDSINEENYVDEMPNIIIKDYNKFVNLKGGLSGALVQQAYRSGNWNVLKWNERLQDFLDDNDISYTHEKDEINEVIKVGDNVIVNAGKYKNAKGKVVSFVDGVNAYKVEIDGKKAIIFPTDIEKDETIKEDRVGSDDASYEVKGKSNEKIYAFLKKHKATNFTKLIKSLEEIDATLADINEKKQVLTAQQNVEKEKYGVADDKLRDMVVDLFDAEESVNTLYVEANGALLTLAKKTEKNVDSIEITTNVDYKKAWDSLTELYADTNLGLVNQMNELLQQFTTVTEVEKKATKRTLRRDTKPAGVLESVLREFKLSDIWNSFTGYLKKFNIWQKLFGKKLESTKQMISSL